MDTLLHFLYVEDNPNDVELVRETLASEKFPYTITRVDTREDYITNLDTGKYDLVISDFTLPRFSGLEALKILRQRDANLPFILISGTIGEQRAVEVLKNGATDYLLKNHLVKLGSAIRRALAESAERRQLHDATEQLKTSEAQLAEAQRIAHIGNWVWDIPKNEITWSDEMFNIFKVPEHGRKFTCEEVYAFIHPEDLPCVESRINSALHDHTSLDTEYRIVLPDGSLRYIHALAKVIVGAGGTPHKLIGTAQDISERKAAENKILELGSIIDRAKDAISVRTLDNRILFWNKGAEKLYGWNQEEVLGIETQTILVKDEHLPESFNAIRIATEKGEWYGEMHHITKTGTGLIVQSHWTLVRDEQGRPKSFLVISTDITEKKQYEMQFLRAQRMESIGTLASGIAHDLNNILSPIMLASEILMRKADHQDRTQLLERIQQNAKRGADVVKQVLSFARGMDGQYLPIQIRHLIDEIGKIMKETFPKSIYIETDVPKDLQTISGDPTQIHQVLLNLCVNARDAMPAGGKISITASNVKLDESYSRMHAGVKPGDYVFLKISDTGTGIPQNILDKIFDPFFTTKEVGKGTGLGLFTVHSIVKNHGGFINVHSAVGTGTSFEIYFPTTTASVSAQELSGELARPTGNNETILVVDDEAGIREITKEILTNNGYQVITAGDGTEAVMMFAQHQSAIRVVLTDIRMPYMDGIAAMRAIWKIDPGVKIIASSGSGDVHLAENKNLSAFLVKPFTASNLLMTLERVIKGK